MERFYKLTLNRAIANRAAGKLTTYGLLDYYIRIKTNNRCDRKLIINPYEVCRELNITMPQFYCAISKVGLDPDLSRKVNFVRVAYLFNQKSKIK